MKPESSSSQAEPTAPVSRYRRGQRVPGTNYSVVSLLGVGGMGAVYEVEHVELGRRFVLKALHHRLVKRDDLVGRMNNEWRVLGRLDHPNIVRVTDAGRTSDELPFFVMEKLEGTTLGQLLKKRGRLSVAEAFVILDDVLAGLEAAHAEGAIHRDIKPQNIFVSDEHGTKLLDFGIAKLRAQATKVITASGVAVGTPRFMAPEQAQGGVVDARADIYAVGLVLYEAIVGRGPFAHIKDPNRLVLAHMGETPERADALFPPVGEAVGDLLQRWLSKDPAARPRNVSLARAELLAVSRTVPATAEAADSDVTRAGDYEATTAGATDSWGDDLRTFAPAAASTSELEGFVERALNPVDVPPAVALAGDHAHAGPESTQALGSEREELRREVVGQGGELGALSSEPWGPALEAQHPIEDTATMDREPPAQTSARGRAGTLGWGSPSEAPQQLEGQWKPRGASRPLLARDRQMPPRGLGGPQQPASVPPAIRRAAVLPKTFERHLVPLVVAGAALVSFGVGLGVMFVGGVVARSDAEPEAAMTVDSLPGGSQSLSQPAVAPRPPAAAASLQGDGPGNAEGDGSTDLRPSREAAAVQNHAPSHLDVARTAEDPQKLTQQAGAAAVRGGAQSRRTVVPSPASKPSATGEPLLVGAGEQSPSRVREPTKPQRAPSHGPRPLPRHAPPSGLW